MHLRTEILIIKQFDIPVQTHFSSFSLKTTIEDFQLFWKYPNLFEVNSILMGLFRDNAYILDELLCRK